MSETIGRRRPRAIPALFAAGVVLVCASLGFWQLDRLAWKRGLIAERQAASHAAPVPLPSDAAAARALAFHPVAAVGTFLHDKEMFLGAAGTGAGGKPGFHVLTPLREADGRVIFVNRGFITAELRESGRRAAGQVAGTVRVAGLLRLPQAKPGWMVPDNRPDLNYWFWVDLPAMGRAAGFPNAAPFYIDADATPNPGGWPKGGVTPIDLPNDHLQYALTWFSLAVAGIVIYVVWRRQPAGEA